MIITPKLRAIHNLQKRGGDNQVLLQPSRQMSGNPYTATTRRGDAADVARNIHLDELSRVRRDADQRVQLAQQLEHSGDLRRARQATHLLHEGLHDEVVAMRLRAAEKTRGHVGRGDAPHESRRSRHQSGATWRTELRQRVSAPW